MPVSLDCPLFFIASQVFSNVYLVVIDETRGIKFIHLSLQLKRLFLSRFALDKTLCKLEDVIGKSDIT